MSPTGEIPFTMDVYPTDEETALYIALNRAQRSIYVSIDTALKEKRLPPLRWYDVLWSIERAGDGGLRPFELEASTIFEQSNLSRALRRMTGQGLIEVSVCPEDRRGKVLHMTAKGRRVRKAMWKIFGPLIHAHMSALSGEYDVKEVAAALNSLQAEEG